MRKTWADGFKAGTDLVCKDINSLVRSRRWLGCRAVCSQLLFPASAAAATATSISQLNEAGWAACKLFKPPHRERQRRFLQPLLAPAGAQRSDSG